MSNEINSVAGQLVGIPVGQVYTAGKGIKIDNVNKVVSVDETELWTGDLKGQNSTANLSDSVINFERIKVYGHTDDGSEYGWSYELETYGLTRHYQIGVSVSNNGWSKWFVFGLNGTVLTNVCGKALTWGSATWSNINNNWGITKVVGINRIAGGN